MEMYKNRHEILS